MKVKSLCDSNQINVMLYIFFLLPVVVYHVTIVVSEQ